MEYFNKILCVTYEELTGGDSPIITPCTLRQNMRRGNITSVHRGGGEGGQALYAWSSLPEKYKERFTAKYGNPEEIMRDAMTKDSVRLDAEARVWYENFRYEKNGEQVGLTDKLIEEYTINASVLSELLKLMSERRAMRQSLNAPVGGAWEAALGSSEKMRAAYGHTLPESLARLKAKLKAFKEDGYASLLSGKIGNRNTLKITPEFGRLLIALKRCRVPVYNDRQLFDEANRRAVENGWKPLRSLSGMKAWLNMPEIMPLWYGAVYGEQEARQKFGRKQKTALPTRRDSLWYGDGTKLNLYYMDDEGKTRTTQVYVVIDAMSEVMLGWHISDKEDYEAQYMAYRMAIQTAGFKPYEIVHDNQGGHKRLNKPGGKNSKEQGFLDKICHIHRATMPYNGQSKTIEAVFGRFQTEVLHKDWRFTGQNITAKKDSSRPNLEFTAENKDKLYTLAELKEAYAKASIEWNNLKHPSYDMSRIEAYHSSVNEDTQAVTEYDMVDMFWVTAPRLCTFTDQGLQVTINGKKRPYEVFSSPGVPDHVWRAKHTYERFVVKYDPYATQSIRLYSQDKDGSLRFVTTAEPYIVVPRAIQDQKAADQQFIRQELARNTEDRVEREVAGRLIEKAHGMMPEQNGLRSPRPKGMSAEEVRQIERRASLYSLVPAEIELGRATKQVSMETWDEAETSVVDFNLKRTVGKI